MGGCLQHWISLNHRRFCDPSETAVGPFLVSCLLILGGPALDLSYVSHMTAHGVSDQEQTQQDVLIMQPVLLLCPYPFGMPLSSPVRQVVNFLSPDLRLSKGGKLCTGVLKNRYRRLLSHYLSLYLVLHLPCKAAKHLHISQHPSLLA